MAFGVLGLALACSSCGTAVRVRMTFRGRNVADSAGLIRVRGEKELGRIVVESPGHGLVLSFPYGEDWEVEAAGTEARIELIARSQSDVGLTVWLRPREGDLVGDGQDHLRDKVLRWMRVMTWLSEGRLEDVSVSPHERGPVLRCVQVYPPGDGKAEERHVHAWTVRRSGTGSLFYELWLWGFPAPKPESAALHERLVEIAGREFELR